MFDYRALVILMTLMDHCELSLYELSVKVSLPIKEVKEGIDYLVPYLANKGIVLDKKQGRYSLSNRTKQSLTDIIKSDELVLPKSTRLALIYLYTFCRLDFISNNHYQDFLKVSKNTTLSDIQSLRKIMLDNDLELGYSRAKGYTLHGSEWNKHRLAFQMVSELLESSIGIWGLDYVLSSWGYSLTYDLIDQVVKDYYEKLQIVPIVNQLKVCLFGLVFIICRYQRDVERVCLSETLVSPIIQDITTILLDTVVDLGIIDTVFSEDDYRYVTVLLSSCFEGEVDVAPVYFNQLTESIISRMEDISLLHFKQREVLRENLRRHLIPAYYRLKFGLPSSNEYVLHVKEHYPDLFELVKDSLTPLMDAIDKPIPDSETAYFVIHFGGYLKKADNLPQKCYKAAIICPNGISSSLMIKENLLALFPQIEFIGTSKIDDLYAKTSSDYDMVFSTIKVDTEKPNYLVSVMMTEEQTTQLVELVSKDFPDTGYRDIELDQIISIVRRYSVITQELELKLALKRYLYQEMNRKEVLPLLEELITKETYQVSSEKLGWKEAIRLAAKPLLDQHKITENYPEAMIQKVEEFGPFINLGKGVAIPHARPDEGVNEIGMSMLVLEEPIYLLDNPEQEVRLLICIAAIDNESHLKALSHLTTILRDKNHVQTLISSKNYDDIEMIIKQED
jgi:phosphoenolpyruvate-dependent sugar phosphotransferase system, EIIA 2 family protein